MLCFPVVGYRDGEGDVLVLVHEAPSQKISISKNVLSLLLCKC